MVSRALATLDLVDHDDARPAFPAVYLEGRTVLSYGELAGSADESGRVLRHDSRALVLCAGDRDLATLLAYLAGTLFSAVPGPPRQRARRRVLSVRPCAGRGVHCARHPGGLPYSDAEPRRTVPAMAAAYAGTVRAVRPTGPYLACGCGIGAAIACEMAARLDDVGSWPRPAPDCWNHRTPVPSPGWASRPGNRAPGPRVARAVRLTSDEHRHRDRSAPLAPPVADPDAAGPGRVRRGAGRRGTAHLGPARRLCMGERDPGPLLRDPVRRASRCRGWCRSMTWPRRLEC